MDLFSLAAKLTLDSTGFDRGIEGAEKSGKGLASSLEGTFSKIKKFAAGAISVAALKKGFDAVMNLAKATSDYGDKVDKQSQVLGLSRKAYQEWDYILGQNGASIDSLSMSMKTLNALILDAAAGGKESKNAFAQLGVGIHELEQLEPEKQFEAVVRAFQRMPAGAQKSALAVKIFGRNGMELLPLLNQSETSIDELRKRAEELGIVMSDDAVDASVAYNDAMDDLNRTFNGLRYSFGSKLLPVLTSGVQKITNYAGKLSRAFQEGGISKVLDTIGESAENLIRKLKESDSPIFQFIGNSLETIKGLFEWIVENKESVIGAVGGIVAAFAVTKILSFVASLNPLTVIFTLIAGAIGLVAANWDKVKEWIGKAWDTTVSFVSEGWETIKGAFDTVASWVGEKANEIKLAFTATVSEWFTRIKEWLDGTGLTEIALNFGAKVAEWIETIKGWFDGKGISDITINFGAKIAEWIDRIWNWAQNGIDVAVNFLTSGLSGAGGESHDVYGDWHGNPIFVDPKADVASHAKGLNYVPFDGYPALLHRGEQVLTASAARRNRGISGGSTGIDAGVIASAVADAIRSAMQGVSVNSYLSGKDITDSVDRDMARKLKARRFAT